MQKSSSEVLLKSWMDQRDQSPPTQRAFYFFSNRQSTLFVCFLCYKYTLWYRGDTESITPMQTDVEERTFSTKATHQLVHFTTQTWEKCKIQHHSDIQSTKNQHPHIVFKITYFGTNHSKHLKCFDDSKATQIMLVLVIFAMFQWEYVHIL